MIENWNGHPHFNKIYISNSLKNKIKISCKKKYWKFAKFYFIWKWRLQKYFFYHSSNLESFFLAWTLFKAKTFSLIIFFMKYFDLDLIFSSFYVLFYKFSKKIKVTQNRSFYLIWIQGLCRRWFWSRRKLNRSKLLANLR